MRRVGHEDAPIINMSADAYFILRLRLQSEENRTIRIWIEIYSSSANMFNRSSAWATLLGRTIKNVLCVSTSIAMEMIYAAIHNIYFIIS